MARGGMTPQDAVLDAVRWSGGYGHDGRCFWCGLTKPRHAAGCDIAEWISQQPEEGWRALQVRVADSVARMIGRLP